MKPAELKDIYASYISTPMTKLTPIVSWNVLRSEEKIFPYIVQTQQAPL